MLREFISIFRSDDPLSAMGENFTRMLELTSKMVTVAGDMFFKGSAAEEARQRVYKDDIQVNKLERAIRKQVVTHLSIRSRTADLPYCLYLLNLVKDVERLGDYAKNLTEIITIRPGPPPTDELVDELAGIRTEVEQVFEEISDVVGSSNRERALELLKSGRELRHRCDLLVSRVAEADYDGRTALALGLVARYYKRVAAHLLNVLTSVVMPLHKLDFFDEDDVLQWEGQDS